VTGFLTNGDYTVDFSNFQLPNSYLYDNYRKPIHYCDTVVDHSILRVINPPYGGDYSMIVAPLLDLSCSLTGVTPDENYSHVLSINFVFYMKEFLCFAAFCLMLYVWNCYVVFKYDQIPFKNKLFSWYVSFLMRFGKQLEHDVTDVRTRFDNSNKAIVKPTSNHSHPQCAEVRTSSRATIDFICLQMGLNTYTLDKSPVDERRGRDGCKYFSDAKDLSVNYAHFNPKPDDVIVMVDSDMYIDMPILLSNYPHIYMISTFQPTAVSESTGEYSFTFRWDNTVKYSVSGGAEYRHGVWNYGSDIILCVSTGFLMTHYRITAYNINRRQISAHHQILCLVPYSSFISPIVNISDWLEGMRLSQLNVVRGCFTRLEVQTANGRLISTGKPDTYSVAVTSVSSDAALARLSQYGKTQLTLATVKTVTQLDDPNAASILTLFHCSKVEYSADCVYPVSCSIKNYSYEPDSFDPNDKQLLVSFMSPILNKCYAPLKNLANDKAAIKERAVDIRNGELDVSALMVQYMREFAVFLIPDELKGTGSPYDQEVVYERQNRPSQRAILDRANMSTKLTSKLPVQTFIKAEPYGDIKPPRIISTIPGETKANYAGYIYAFTELVMSLVGWYAFGKDPLSIALMVVKICEAAKLVVNTDLSRFDGRVSNLARMLEKIILIRFFKPKYYNDIAELLRKHQNQRAFTKFGAEYITWLIRLSGSADTAVFNSIINAFMAYATYRKMGKSTQEAWDALGIYGGDDGLSADIDDTTYVSIATEVGQSLEIEVILRGQIGVNFLARFFSEDVWTGCPDSMCDISRQLSKLHVTPHLAHNVTAMDKLGEKMIGYFLTDKNTPIIGQIATMIKTHYPEMFPKEKLTLRTIANGFASYDEDVQFPNENSLDWMMTYCDKALPEFDYVLFESWLNACISNKELLLSPPLCIPNETEPEKYKVDVVVNDDVVRANGTKLLVDRQEQTRIDKEKSKFDDEKRMEDMPDNLKLFEENVMQQITTDGIIATYWCESNGNYYDKYGNDYNLTEVMRIQGIIQGQLIKDKYSNPEPHHYRNTSDYALEPTSPTYTPTIQTYSPSSPVSKYNTLTDNTTVSIDQTNVVKPTVPDNVYDVVLVVLNELCGVNVEIVTTVIDMYVGKQSPFAVPIGATTKPLFKKSTPRPPIRRTYVAQKDKINRNSELLFPCTDKTPINFDPMGRMENGKFVAYVMPNIPVPDALKSNRGDKIKYCISFQTASCKFGDKCIYTHAVDPDYDGICGRFQSGTCTFAKCKYAHVLRK